MHAGHRGFLFAAHGRMGVYCVRFRSNVDCGDLLGADGVSLPKGATGSVSHSWWVIVILVRQRDGLRVTAVRAHSRSDGCRYLPTRWCRFAAHNLAGAFGFAADIECECGEASTRAVEKGP